VSLFFILFYTGVKIVICTGGRLSTVASRLPSLPAADAIICENGGRIFYPSEGLYAHLMAAGWMEDTDWRNRLAEYSAPFIEEQVPAVDRQGHVWDAYRELLTASDSTGEFSIDPEYTTGFRVKAAVESGSKNMERRMGSHEVVCGSAALGSLERWKDVLLNDTSKSYHGKIQVFFNLGMMDVLPVISGKHNAAVYVVERLGGSWERSAFLCDDDNDLPLAKLVKKAFLPGITHPSVAKAIAENPTHYVVASDIVGRPVHGTMAADVVVDAAARFFAQLPRASLQIER